MADMHFLNLNPTPFSLIKSGRKKIEMRLFDERRKVLKVGDNITFTNNETNEQLVVQITGLKQFKNFEELYSFYNKEDLGYSKDETANADDMLIYYTKEKIAMYGVLAIQIKLII